MALGRAMVAPPQCTTPGCFLQLGSPPTVGQQRAAESKNDNFKNVRELLGFVALSGALGFLVYAFAPLNAQQAIIAAFGTASLPLIAGIIRIYSMGK